MKTTVRIPHQLEIELPAIPSKLEKPGYKGSLYIEELSDEALQFIGEQWTVALIEKARKTRAETEEIPAAPEEGAT